MYCRRLAGQAALPRFYIDRHAWHGAGGVLMCAGPDFSGTFDACTFDQCTLYAVHGAHVGLHYCLFERCAPAVVATGAATAAHFTGCFFKNCQTGPIADHVPASGFGSRVS